MTNHNKANLLVIGGFHTNKGNSESSFITNYKSHLNLTQSNHNYLDQSQITAANSSLTAKKYAEPGDVMTVAGVARFLKCSEKTIYRMCNNGEIPFKRTRKGSYRFWKPEIEQWLKGTKNE